MISLGKDSKLAPSKVIDRAVVFFGPGGLGLVVMDQADCCARFEGAGGHVFIQAMAGDNGRGSQVSIEAVEWERQAEKFLAKI